jgi:peptide/nickel transport system substrate-binding protein
VRGRLPLLATVIALGAIVVGGGAGGQTREGGVFRVAFWGLDSVDPALAYGFESWTLLDATCAQLMRYPDLAPPAGLQIQPEAATGFPQVSDGGRTFTFTLRSGLRFSDGSAVHASAFARAIERTLAPGIESGGADYTSEIVGAERFHAGKARSVTGVVARGNRLVVRLKQPTPDFPARTTMPFFCAVPPGLPADPEGLGSLPGAGPYYIAEYRAGQRVVLRRNRFYRGNRPHHVDGFTVDLQAGSAEDALDLVERGEVDWAPAVARVALDPQRKLVEKYGVNRGRFFINPGLTWRGLALNTSRPLFRNNPRLRRAVNFAVNRRAFRAAAGGVRASRLIDQYLPTSMPGFVREPIYPQRPNVAKARALARGHTRSGKAVLYQPNIPAVLAQAQVLKDNLAAIGIVLEIKALTPSAIASRLSHRGEPWDIAGFGLGPDYYDPYSYINVTLDGRFAGLSNVGWYDSAKYNRLMRTAARLQGAGRGGG